MNDFKLGGSGWSHADLDTFYRYNEATSDLADKCYCLFIDLLSAYRGADWLIHYDGCHANDLGYRLVANTILEVLASNYSGLALETKDLEKNIIPWRDESTLQTSWEQEHHR